MSGHTPMVMDSECMVCHLQRNVQLAQKMGDEKTATAFAKELMKLYLSAPEDVSSPHFAMGTEALLSRFYGLEGDRYKEEKEISNRFVLERLDTLRERVDAQADPLLAALQFAILGNYIDFSALRGNVSFEKLDEMLESALEMELDRQILEDLRGELQSAKRVLYVTDNAGEIGFDRICAETIARLYPQLQITFCVRGGNAMNDATRCDAEAVGIPYPIIDNGTCIPGTDLAAANEETKRAFREADVILSKGMGNVETLFGCGYNVYYAFLVKCSRFVQRFGKPLLTPMLIREMSAE